MHEPSHFVAEQYVPSGRSWAPGGSFDGIDGAARTVCVLYMPEDELCLYVLEAASREAVIEAGRGAGTPFDRVSTARFVTAIPRP